MPIRYTHTNIVARNWRSLAQFYQDIFDCRPAPPERDYAGAWLDKAVGLENVHLAGIHLRLPGYGDEGPTLEIFQYDTMPARPKIQANTPGLAHLAFAVDDVAAVAQNAMAAGAEPVGELTVREVAGIGVLTFQYLRDPEGNIVEIQHWAKPTA